MSVVTKMIFAFLLAWSCNLSAAVIVSQAPPESGNGYVSDFNYGFVNQQAQLVELASDDSVESVVVWGYYETGVVPASDNFTIRFFSDAAGEPDTTPFDEQMVAVLSREATSFTGTGGEVVYKYSFNLSSSVTLTGSTKYYVSVVNDINPAEYWIWSGFSGGNDMRWNRTGVGVWGGAQTDNVAFELSNTPVLTQPPMLAPRAVPVFGVWGFALTSIGILFIGAISTLRRPSKK